MEIRGKMEERNVEMEK